MAVSSFTSKLTSIKSTLQDSKHLKKSAGRIPADFLIGKEKSPRRLTRAFALTVCVEEEGNEDDGQCVHQEVDLLAPLSSNHGDWVSDEAKGDTV